jgi:hypothetical protein
MNNAPDSQVGTTSGKETRQAALGRTTSEAGGAAPARLRTSMSADASKQHYGPLPLVVGVTGHRDLRESDQSKLKEQVSAIFEKLFKDFPHTPITLLSPLAEGADRLVARVGLELKVPIIVPLPLPRQSYEEDFKDAASRAEFDEMLGLADHWFELPPIGNYTEAEVRQQGGAPRGVQYEHVGAYIARHCQILIALWDGTDKGAAGGTARVVKFQTEGVPEPFAPPRSALDAVEAGPVFHIATPRVSSPQTTGEAYKTTVIFPTGYPADLRIFERVFGKMETFNRDAVKLASVCAAEQQENMKRLLPDEQARRLPPALRALRECYGVTDALTAYFQRRTKMTLRWLYVLVFTAALCFGLYNHLFMERHLILTVYLLILAVANYGFYYRAKKGEYQNKYQDYRAVTEGLRVQFFWSLAQLDLSVADHYLRKQKSELDWIRNAVRVWSMGAGEGARAASAALSSEERLGLVLKHWVENQFSYFSARARADREKLERCERWSRFLLYAGVLIAVALVLWLGVSYAFRPHLSHLLTENKRLHGTIILLMSMPPIAAALLHSYAEKSALSEHAKQYGRMSATFDAARNHLVRILNGSKRDGARLMDEDGKAARELIKDLGIEALEENGDWVLLHRERPIDLPHAG